MSYSLLKTEPPDTAAHLTEAERSLGGAMKLLLVEDEPRLQRSLAKALREEHYAVDLAGTGEEGLFKAESVGYDVVILDVMLPLLDGWQVLERLRQRKSTPVLMLTARDASIDRVRGLDLGADDYLIKPFDLPELLARIRALIRRMAGVAAAVIRLDDIVIDPRSRTVIKADMPIRLTAREFCILEYLAIHRGKAVSRTELHDHLLDENEDTLSNLLDVHVYAIRKKLGAHLISTRRGHGYCIA
jgi:two-component system OmpR family response regulator